MGMPVRIDDDLYAQAKTEAAAEHRTIAAKLNSGPRSGVTHWTTPTCRRASSLSRSSPWRSRAIAPSLSYHAAVAHELCGRANPPFWAAVK